MKQLILIILFTLFVTVLWESLGTSIINARYAIDQKALDLSKPFSVKIDLELLKEIKELSESTATP